MSLTTRLINCFVLGSTSSDAGLFRIESKSSTTNASTSETATDQDETMTTTAPDTLCSMQIKIASALEVTHPSQIHMFAPVHKPPSEFITPRHPLLDPKSPHVLKALELIGASLLVADIVGDALDDRAVWLLDKPLETPIDSVLPLDDASRAGPWNKIDLLIVVVVGADSDDKPVKVTPPSNSWRTFHESRNGTSAATSSDEQHFDGAGETLIQPPAYSAAAAVNDWNVQPTIDDERQHQHQQQQHQPAMAGSLPSLKKSLGLKEGGSSAWKEPPQPHQHQPQQKLNFTTLLLPPLNADNDNNMTSSAKSWPVTEISNTVEPSEVSSSSSSQASTTLFVRRQNAYYPPKPYPAMPVQKVAGPHSPPTTTVVGTAGSSRIYPYFKDSDDDDEVKSGRNRTGKDRKKWLIVVIATFIIFIIIFGVGLAIFFGTHRNSTAESTTSSNQSPQPAAPATSTSSSASLSPSPTPTSCVQVNIDQFNSPFMNLLGFPVSDDNTLTNISYSGGRIHFRPQPDLSSYLYEKLTETYDSCPSNFFPTSDIRYIVFNMYGEGNLHFAIRSGPPCTFPFKNYPANDISLRNGVKGATYSVDLKQYLPQEWYEKRFIVNFAWEGMNATSDMVWSISTLVGVNDLTLCGFNSSVPI